MQKLLDGLRYFQEHLFWEREELFERSTHGQRPQAMLITCSDSRVLPDHLWQSDPGDLFVARNAGNIVPPPGVPSGEAATVEYAVTALGVTDIIVCGHYRCGAVKALLQPGDCSGLPRVTEWLCHAAAAQEELGRDHAGLTGDALWDRAVEQNALVQLRNLEQHPVVAAGIAAKTLRLHAWVLRFESGEVLAYDPHTGAFVPLAEMPIVRAALPAPELEPEPGPTLPAPAAADRPVEQPSTWGALKSDLPASLVVFAVALPLCVAIAKACGVPTAAGIITAVIGGVVVGLLGGGSLQVSGPTAGLIVILLDTVDRLGVAALGAVVVLAGLLQVAGGVLRLGQWFRVVSPAVILGMLAGIGVVLFSQQLHVTVDDVPDRNPLTNFVNMPHAAVGMFDDHGHDGHVPAALIGMLTLAVLVLWKPLAPKRLGVMPSVLAAVVAATGVAYALELPIRRVEFDGLSSGVQVLDVGALRALLAGEAVWRAAVTVALVASAETLLTAAAVDQMHPGPRTRYDRELAAQGGGNLLCGALGALPMASVIVRSSANVQAGARSRWATVLHGVWLLAFVLAAPALLRAVPTAALAAALVLTGIRLVQFSAIRKLWNESAGEGWICVATAVAVVCTDLLAGVLLGIALSVAKLVYTFSRLRVRTRGEPSSGRMTLALEGVATFISLPRLAAALDAVPAGAVLHIDIKGLSYTDHACLELLMKWGQRYEATGGRLVLDWDVLRARFYRVRPRPRREYPGSDRS